MPLKVTKIIGYAPDLPSTTPGTITNCNGVLATPRGIGAPPTFAASTTDVVDSSTIAGSAQLTKADGTVKIYIGTPTKLWEFNGISTLTDRSGAVYAATSSQGWSFASFGDIALAANKGNTIQKASGGVFSDLATAPKAAIICNVGPPSSPFIMALNYNDGTDTPDGWFCSGISDYTTWNSAAAQSVNGRLLEPTGPFIAAVPFRDGILAWKKNAMYRGDYVGSPVVWQWTRIASDIGCCGKNMAVVVNDVVYFADRKGFWTYDGSYPQHIPGGIHTFWGTTIATTVRDTHFMKWDPSIGFWVCFPEPILGVPAWIFWNKLSGVWGASRHFDSATSSTLVNIITLDYPSFWTIHQDAKISRGTFGSGTGNTSFDTWGEGDMERYLMVDRIRPYFIGYNVPTLPASGTCALSTYVDSALSTATVGSTVNLDLTNGLKFDVMGSGNFITAHMTFTGQWEMSHIGMSISDSGTRGKQ